LLSETPHLGASGEGSDVRHIIIALAALAASIMALASAGHVGV